MKTVILFLVTTVLSTGALLASLSMKSPLIGTAIAFGIIILFFSTSMAQTGTEQDKGEDDTSSPNILL